VRRSDPVKRVRYVRIATIFVPILVAAGMVALTVQSAGHVPGWFLLALALTAVNGLLVAYTMHLESAHGSGLTIRRLNLVSRSLTWAMLVAVAVMLLKLR
jgi:fatty acid desaturase